MSEIYVNARRGPLLGGVDGMDGLPTGAEGSGELGGGELGAGYVEESAELMQQDATLRQLLGQMLRAKGHSDDALKLVHATESS